jgi:DNA recombination protein RmuC
MALFAIIALSVFLLISVVLNGIWRTQRNHLRDDHNRLVTERDQLSLVNRELENELTQAKTKLEGMDDRFRSVASEVLDGVNKQFKQWAQQTFEGEQKQAAAQLDQRKQAIEQMLKPFKETLDKYNTAVIDVEKARKQAYGELRTQLGSLLDDQRLLRQQTTNLVQALRRPEVRGRWGEMQLKRVAELAGMIEHCDFDEQVSLATEGGQLRPDMVVHLPGDRTIIIDAKTPLDAYLNAIETEDVDQRRTFIEAHVRQIATKVTDLSGKAYRQQFERAVDFVVLFIPGEPFLAAAVQARPDLIEWAMDRSVIIATPSTLVALLKAVAAGWREQKIAANAQQISDLGRELHERLVVALGHLDRVGSSLESSIKAYNSFVGSFESRVIVSARKLEELGAASKKQIAESMKSVDLTPRQTTGASQAEE